MTRVFLISVLAMTTFAASVAAQTTIKTDPSQVKEVGPIRSSAAYAEVLLRKTELQSDLESMISDYTEQNPKVIDTRFELAVLTKDIDRLFAVRPSETSKLTEALGRMIVRHAGLETELNRMLRTYSADHPEVKRLKRKVEIFSAALKEILG
jgi:hypothetical protein